MSLIIYKITIPNCDKVYIGSTINITQRISQHKEYSKYYFNPNLQLYYMIRDNGGWDSCVLEIIETGATKEREQFWINSLSPNVFNKNNPTGMGQEQYLIRRRKNSKKHYENIKNDVDRWEKRKEYMREYHKKRKELRES